jgi:hypothetical protein
MVFSLISNIYHIKGIMDNAQLDTLNFISPNEGENNFNELFPHMSFSPPQTISWLLHKHKPKEVGLSPIG